MKATLESILTAYPLRHPCDVRNQGEKRRYLDECRVHHGPRRGSDVGGDDAEAKAVKRTADLGDGVPPVGAGDAHHQHLIPGVRHPHLSFQETDGVDRFRSVQIQTS